MKNNIKTFDDACHVLNLDPSTLPVVTGLPARHQKAITAHFKLIIIAEALNEGWKPKAQIVQSAKTFQIQNYKNIPNTNLHSLHLLILTGFWRFFAQIFRVCFLYIFCNSVF